MVELRLGIDGDRIGRAGAWVAGGVDVRAGVDGDGACAFKARSGRESGAPDQGIGSGGEARERAHLGHGDIGGIKAHGGFGESKRDRRSGVGLVQAGIDDFDGDRRDAGDGVGLGVSEAGESPSGVRWR